MKSFSRVSRELLVAFVAMVHAAVVRVFEKSSLSYVVCLDVSFCNAGTTDFILFSLHQSTV